jgi:hypothetical protein
MDFKSITSKAKDLIDKRGGTDSLKEDAEELKDIATGDGSISDKAKEAVEAVKDPGAEAAPAEHSPGPEEHGGGRHPDRGPHGGGHGGGRHGEGKRHQQ